MRTKKEYRAEIKQDGRWELAKRFKTLPQAKRFVRERFVKWKRKVRKYDLEWSEDFSFYTQDIEFYATIREKVVPK